MSVEDDWMEFMWNVTRGDNAWTISNFFGLQKAACGTGCRCEDQAEVGVRAWETYETLFAAPPPEMGLSTDQWQQFDDYGDACGVSLDLTP